MYGPRYCEPGHEGDVKGSTLTQYRHACERFLRFLSEDNFVPEVEEEWDDLMVEWSFSSPEVKPATFRLALAGLEFLFPRFRGRLTWTKQRLGTMSRCSPPRHTAPAGYEACLLIGAQLASLHRARIGLGMLVQVALGLRPGELLQLSPSDISINPEYNRRHLAIFRLGRIRGTKSGREQFAILNLTEFSELWKVLCIALRLTPPGERVYP